MNFAPIVIFAYNRPEHLKRTIAALARNSEVANSELTIFSDGPRRPTDEPKIAAVRRVAHEAVGFAALRVVERERNYGLANSIIGGVSDILTRHDSVIVLEDDIEAAPNFLHYMNLALERYRNDAGIFSISSFRLPITISPPPVAQVCLIPRCVSGAWGTWRDRWERVDWDVLDRDLLRDRKVRAAFDVGGSDLSDMLERQLEGKLDSWAIRFNWAHFRSGAGSIMPILSKTRNFGFDGTGINSGCSTRFDVVLDDGRDEIRFPDLLVYDERILIALRRLYDKSVRRRFKRYWRALIGR